MPRKASGQAYYLIDLNELTPAQRAEVVEDAALGGGDFGVRVVEIIHNGPAQTSLYGVYYGADDDLWHATLEEFAADGGGELSEEQEDAIRTRASALADADAAAQEKAEQAALAKAGVTTNKAKV